MIPTKSEIREQILTDIESETSKTRPSLPVSVWNYIATAFAGPFYLMYKYVQWTYNQIFVATADRPALILKGAEFNLTPTPAQKFIGEADLTGTVNGTNIPSGSILTVNNVIYQTTALATITAGVATVAIESADSGASTTLQIGNTLTFTSPIAGVDRIATVSAVTQEGEDSEDTEAFRNRIQLRQRLQPQGGSIPDYILWALEVAGIGEAYAFRPTPGFVNVYPLTNDPDPANRIPSGAKLTEVTDYLVNLRERPLNSNVNAVAFSEITFNVEIGNLFPDSAGLRAAIDSQLEDYFYTRRPKQFLDEANPRDIMSVSDIATIATNAGASSLTVVMKIQPADTSLVSYTLNNNELAFLGTVTYI